MKKTTARFKSDNTIYTPHGLGVAYSNANLTDKAARDIIQNDPDAKALFETLPGEASEEERAAPAQHTAEPATVPAQQALALPAGFDYNALAKAMLDEAERRHAEAEAKEQLQEEQDTEQQPELTASAGGAAAGEPEVQTQVLDNQVEVTTGSTEGAADENHDEEKPLRLSRMSKPQLLDTYRTELGHEADAALTNDELRTAIAEHRAAQG